MRIATSARLRGVRHESQRVPLARNSRREVPSDVTRAPNLRGFPCRPARKYRPGNPLRTFREQNTQHAARDTPHTHQHGTLAYILIIHEDGLYPTWSVLVMDCDRVDVRLQAVREMRHGPRTRHRANPAL